MEVRDQEELGLNMREVHRIFFIGVECEPRIHPPLID